MALRAIPGRPLAGRSTAVEAEAVPNVPALRSVPVVPIVRGFKKRKIYLRGSNPDRCRYLHWVFEAKKRFDLSVLNYMLTSNHVHLLVKDTGPDVIAQSVQLIAGRPRRKFGVDEIGVHASLNGQTDI